MKYKKEFASRLPSMFANGEDVSEVALSLGVTRRTFYHWVEKHKAFAEAYEQGKLASEAWWCKLGRAGATGKVQIQSSVWIFNMKNKFGYRDQPAKEPHEGEIKVNIDLRSSDDIMKERGIPIPTIDVPDMGEDMGDIFIPEVDEAKAVEEKSKPDTEALIQSLEKLKGKAIEDKAYEKKNEDAKSKYKNVDDQAVVSPFGDV